MTRRVSADTPLSDVEEHHVGLALSHPISHRVDELVRLLEATGERTNRKELMASLILGAPAAGDELAQLVRRYRTAVVRDTLLDPDRGGAVITVPIRKPGPRRRRRE
jgi:hypothetical protein